MDAVAGQPELLGNKYLVLHELVRREGVESLRVVALVERELEIDALAVERHVGVSVRIIIDADLAETEIRGHLVVARIHRHFVEIGIVEIPDLRILYWYADVPLHFPDSESLADFRAAVLRFEGDRDIEGRFRRRAQRDADKDVVFAEARREIGLEAHGLDIAVAAPFEIDRLPDAARVAVALLAVKPPVLVGHGRRSVPHAQFDRRLPALLREWSQLDLERNVAALMPVDELPVHEDVGLPVARADNEEESRRLPVRRNLNLAPVPRAIPLALHSRKRRGPSERHDDLLVELRRTRRRVDGRALRLEGEVPFAVKVHPLGALPVGTRMLRQRNRYGF